MTWPSQQTRRWIFQSRKPISRPASSSPLSPPPLTTLSTLTPKKKPRTQWIVCQPGSWPRPPCLNPGLSTIKTLYWAQIISQTVLIRRLGIVLKSNKLATPSPSYYFKSGVLSKLVSHFPNSFPCCDLFLNARTFIVLNILYPSLLMSRNIYKEFRLENFYPYTSFDKCIVWWDVFKNIEARAPYR